MAQLQRCLATTTRESPAIAKQMLAPCVLDTQGSFDTCRLQAYPFACAQAAAHQCLDCACCFLLAHNCCKMTTTRLFANLEAAKCRLGSFQMGHSTIVAAESCRGHWGGATSVLGWSRLELQGATRSRQRPPSRTGQHRWPKIKLRPLRPLFV